MHDKGLPFLLNKVGEKDPKDIAVHRIAGITALVINLDSSLHGQPSVHSSASSPRYLRESPQAAVPIQSTAAGDKTPRHCQPQTSKLSALLQAGCGASMWKPKKSGSPAAARDLSNMISRNTNPLFFKALKLI